MCSERESTDLDNFRQKGEGLFDSDPEKLRVDDKVPFSLARTGHEIDNDNPINVYLLDHGDAKHFERNPENLNGHALEFGKGGVQKSSSKAGKNESQAKVAHPPLQPSETKNSISPFSVVKAILLRWRIAIRVVPLVCLTISLRVAVWYGAGTGGLVDPSVFTSIIGLTTFVSALLLFGVVQDYKESERMPSELDSAFRGLTAAVQIGHSVGKRPNGASLRESLETVERMFLCLVEVLDCGAALRRENFSKTMTEFRAAERSLFETFISRIDAPHKSLSKPIDSIRRIVGRIYVIQETSYILAGYSLMDGMILAVSVVMTATNWPKETAAGTAMAYTTVITFLFGYLAMLIRDLEDPFHYPFHYNWRCYRARRVLPMTIAEDHISGGSISMATVIVGFGSRLKALLTAAEASEEPDCTVEDGDVSGGGVEGAQGPQGPQGPAGSPGRSRGSIFVEQVQAAKERRPSLYAAHESAAPYEWSFLMVRWALVREAVPWVCAAVAARLAVWYGAGADGWVEPEVFLSFIFLAVLVNSFLLQGVIQDYKEAEKLPSQLASALQGLIAAVQIAHAVSKLPESRALEAGSLRCVEALLLSLIDVLDNSAAGDAADGIYARAARRINEAERRLFRTVVTRLAAFSAIKGLIKPIVAVRAAAARIHVIKQTSYILAGYTLTDCTVGSVLILMTLSRWSRDQDWRTAMCLTVLITLLFTYLRLLVSGLEDPFQYRPGYNRQCYMEERLVLLSAAEAAKYGRSVSMYVLAVDVGQQVRGLMGPERGAAAVEDDWEAVEAEGGGENGVPVGVGTVGDVWTGCIPPAGDEEVLDPSGAGGERWTVRLVRSVVARGRLIARVAPAVVLVTLLRVAVWYGGGSGSASSGYIQQSALRPYLSLVVFVSVVLLQGVVADYKEAERIPGELSCAFQALATSAVVAHQIGREPARARLEESLRAIERMFAAALAVLDARGGESASGGDGTEERSGGREGSNEASRVGADAVLDAAMRRIDESEMELFEVFGRIKAHPGGLFSAGELVRRLVGRVHVIKQTSYMVAGYSLTDCMLVGLAVLLVLVQWPPTSAAGTALAQVIVITFLFGYVAVLIRDLEDPFHYPPGYNLNCYLEGRARTMTISETYSYGGSVSSSIFPVTFGLQLHRLKALARQISGRVASTQVIARPAAGSSTLQDVSLDSDISLQLEWQDEKGYDAPRAASDSSTFGSQNDSIGERLRLACGALLRRWRIALHVVPVTAAVVSARLLVWYAGGVDGWISPSVFLSFLTLSIVVSVFLLQGVLIDYKESEKMPSELAAAFNGLATALATAHAQGKSAAAAATAGTYTLSASLHRVESVLVGLLRVIDCSDNNIHNVYRAAAAEFRQAEFDLVTAMARIEAEPKGILKAFERLRPFLGRLYVIKETSYMLAGYTLMDAVLAALFALLVTAQWSRDGTGSATALFFAVAAGFVFPYVRLLVSDIEDPFRYPDGYNVSCYRAGRATAFSAWEELRCGGAIDVAVLTVGFGRKLHAMLARTDDVTAATAAAARHAAVSDVGGIEKDCGSVNGEDDVGIAFLDMGRNQPVIGDPVEQRERPLLALPDVTLKVMSSIAAAKTSGAFNATPAPAAPGPTAQNINTVLSRTNVDVLNESGYETSAATMGSPGALGDGMAGKALRYALRRCRLAIWTAPAVAIMVCARVAVWFGSGGYDDAGGGDADVHGGWVDQGVFLSFIPLVTFVSSLLLQGVVQDYKESERMPSELAAAFDGLVTAVQVGYATVKGAGDAAKAEAAASTGEGPAGTAGSGDQNSLRAVLGHVERMLLAVVEVLDCKSDDPAAAYNAAAEELVSAERAVYLAFHAVGADPGELDGPIIAVRRTLGRINDIQATSYIPAGYCLMDGMVTAVAVLMTLTSWPLADHCGHALAYTVVITFLFGYVALLMRDLEDPFEYPPEHNRRCYEQRAVPPASPADEFRYGGSLAMQIVTIDFGSQLQNLIAQFPDQERRDVAIAVSLEASSAATMTACLGFLSR